MEMIISRHPHVPDLFHVPKSNSSDHEQTTMPQADSILPPADDIDKAKDSLQSHKRLASFNFFRRDKSKTKALSSNPSLVAAQIESRLYDLQYAVPCSRRKKQIYHLVPVSSESWTTDEYNDRFDFVQGELKKAVDSHPHLRDRAQYINYSLHMVGTTPYSAIPSIVIECKSTDVKPLRDLFRERAREKLYCGKQSKAFKLFNERPQPNPAFNLVYFRTDRDPLNRRAIWKEITADMTSAHTLCGTLIQNRDAKANLGLTFRVGERVLSTTVDHLFGIESTRFTLDEGNGDENSIFTLDSDGGTINYEDMADSDERTLNDEDLVSLNTLWFDESEEDDLVDHEPVYNPSHTSGDQVIAGLGLEHKVTLAYGKKVNGPNPPPASVPFLDYALVEMDTATLNKKSPNSIYLHGHEHPSVTLSRIADRPRFHGVPVYMLSGISGIRTGRLLSGHTYLGSRPGQEMCQAWTLILDESCGLVDGDCGSVVVDQENFAIYGHVVGSNPLQHAYVVPFKSIIEQIKIEFATEQVNLLDPAEFSDTRLKQLDICKAEQLQSLGYCQDSMGTSGISADVMFSTVLHSNDIHSSVNQDQDFPGYDSIRGSTLSNTREASNETRTTADRPLGTVFDEIRSLLEQNMLKSAGTDTDTNTGYFFPNSALKSILTRDRISKVLGGLPARLNNRAPQIAKGFMRVFAILILIDSPESISEFLDQGLSDENLPFIQDTHTPKSPSNFERDSTAGSLESLACFGRNMSFSATPFSKERSHGRDSALGSQEDLTNTQSDTSRDASVTHTLSTILSDSSARERFLNEQWKFIPPCFKQGHHTAIPSEAVLPFIERELVRTGDCNRLYRIEIHPEFNFLTSRSAHNDRGRPRAFALKTYDGVDDKSAWEAEVEAYKLLLNQPNVVKLYGSFTYRNTYNLILEYSEENLETFFSKSLPPSTVREVCLFWSNLFDIALALKRIHGIYRPKADDGDGAESSGCVSRIHFDLKPANILVDVSGTFVLADFGFSHFQRHSVQESGADTSSREAHKDVVDISSVGSLFGEAIKWSSSGTRTRNRGKEKGDWMASKVLELLERISKHEINLEALWQWTLQMSEKIRMRLAALEKIGPDYATRWTSNRRLVDSLLKQDHLRCPIMDPRGVHDRFQKPPFPWPYIKGFLGFRDEARKVRKRAVNSLSLSKEREV